MTTKGEPETRSEAYCKAMGVTLPVSAKTLGSLWAPLLARHVESVRVLIPQRYVPVVETFLHYKKNTGSEESKRFFAQFTSVGTYAKRLIEKRPAAFFGKGWTTVLRDGKVVEDAHEAYKNGGAPVSLDEYLTLEEAQIAALLVISAPAIWPRKDGGRPVQAIAVGITPPKLDEPDLFDALHCVVKKGAAPVDAAGRGIVNGVVFDSTGGIVAYLRDGKSEAAEESGESHWQHVWMHAYKSGVEMQKGTSPNQFIMYFSTAPTDEAYESEKKYMPLKDGVTHLNINVLGRRIRASIEAFLFDCEVRCKAVKKPAYVILERDVFVSPVDPDLGVKEEAVVDGLYSMLSHNVYKNVQCIRLVGFSAEACKWWHRAATVKGFDEYAFEPPIPKVMAPKIEFAMTTSDATTEWGQYFESDVKDKATFSSDYFAVLPPPGSGDADNHALWLADAARREAELLFCVAYALDVNAMPGNTLWRHGMDATPTFPRATVAEAVTPEINGSGTLRTLLVDYGPPIAEQRLDRLYVIADRYYDLSLADQRKNRPISVAAGYGELSRESVALVLSSLDSTSHPGILKPGAVFYDIGSGQGILGLHAYLSLCMAKRMKVVGLEYFANRVALANRAKNLMATDYALLSKEMLEDVTFVQGDATQRDLPAGTTIAYSYDLLQVSGIDSGRKLFDDASNAEPRLIITLGKNVVGDIQDIRKEYDEARKKWTSPLANKLVACPTCLRFISALPPTVYIIKNGDTAIVKLYDPAQLPFMKRITGLKMASKDAQQPEAVDLYVYEVLHPPPRF